MSIEKKAEEALSWITEGNREVPFRSGNAYVVGREAPDWVRELVYKDQDGDSRSDFDVDVVRDALEAVAEAGDDDFEYGHTSTFGSINTKSLADSTALRDAADRVLAEGQAPTNIRDLLERAAADMMRDIHTGVLATLQEEMGNEPDEDEPETP